LSGGQKQRLALAGAVLHQPELLLLDEPTSAVDPESRRQFWAKLFALAEAGTTLLVSTHYMDEAERCHRLAILERGRLVADGTPAALTASLPGPVLEVEAGNARRIEALLANHDDVLGVAQIGNRLRVLLGRADSGQLQQLLRDAGVEARLAAATPNLEDVFVAATRGKLQGKAA
jgi:ABC-2 type transport system ATP-binding protein